MDQLKEMVRAAEVSPMNKIATPEQVIIPTWVTDQESFRRWAWSEEFPERGQFSFLDGSLWVDLSMERTAHNQIKTIMGAVLALLVKREGLGRYFTDGMMLTNIDAGLSTEPDGMFVSRQCRASGKASFKGDSDMEVIGSPDMVLEVVSKTSVRKDTVTLREVYWKAKIGEYWLVNALTEPLQFEIFRRTSAKYVATRKQGGWIKSLAFGKSFKLTCSEGEDGASDFSLETR
jgi:Uma2 family endonuclease